MPNAALAGSLPSTFTRDTQLLSRFDTHFRTQEATSADLLKSALALRYQVYCLERAFEDAAQHLDRLETDALDGRATHGLIFHRPRNQAIGTVRLILPDRVASLPVQRLLGKLDIDMRSYFPLAEAAEVSRFAISREFRRRSSDGHLEMALGAECRSNLPCLGLVQMLLRMSLARGIGYWAALMEPKLLRMLATMGIYFNPIGPLISHHGIRQPSFCHVPTMLDQLLCRKPGNWDIVTDGGTLAYPKASEGDLQVSPSRVRLPSRTTRPCSVNA